jgi:hypothetical protein
MGALKQWQLEHGDDGDLRTFLIELLDRGEMSSATCAVIREAIGSEDPQGVLDEPPEELSALLECSRCCNPIPVSELVESLDNGQLCDYCYHMTSKDD